MIFKISGTTGQLMPLKVSFTSRSNENLLIALSIFIHRSPVTLLCHLRCHGNKPRWKWCNISWRNVIINQLFRQYFGVKNRWPRMGRHMDNSNNKVAIRTKDACNDSNFHGFMWNDHCNNNNNHKHYYYKSRGFIIK